MYTHTDASLEHVKEISFHSQTQIFLTKMLQLQKKKIRKNLAAHSMYEM